MISRRMFLKAGASAIVVTGVAGAWWTGSRAPQKALAPWEKAKEGYGDPRLDALAYAILCPNPHNRQPWQVELIGKQAFNLTCDLDRRLPYTDPFDRQITIGLGCFIELFRMAAAAMGYIVLIRPFPDGESYPRLDKRRVAHIRLVKAAPEKDPLFDAVFDRRSNKEIYDTARPVPADIFAALTAAENIGGTVDPDTVTRLRDLSWRGHRMESLTPRTMMESVSLMRFGKAEVEANPDGIDFSGAKYELLNKTGLMTRENIAEPASDAFAMGMKMFSDRLHSAMGYVWVATPGNSRLDQLNAGQKWVRLNLKATKLDLAVHPLSQALQEYPEMRVLYTELHTFLHTNEPSRLQMFARIGYAPKVDPKPRWSLTSRLVNA